MKKQKKNLRTGNRILKFEEISPIFPHIGISSIGLLADGHPPCFIYV